MTGYDVCLECKECCRWMTFILDPSDPRIGAKYAQFYKARGCSVKVIYGGRLAIMVPKDCPHLTEDGCDTYAKRPRLCEEYDGRNDPFLMHKCKLKG